MKIALKKPAAQVVKEAEKELLSQGGSFVGDETMGAFSISGAYAEYVVSGSFITVNVLEKPLFANHKLIESRIALFFS